MNADELRKLADEVEALTGPSREVDGAIFVTVDPDEFARVRWLYHPNKEWSREQQEAYRDLWGRRRAPQYTLSLDDATHLVPKRLSWGVRQSGFGGADAEIWDPMRSPNVSRIVEVRVPAFRGHPAACALTAAALRARAADLEANQKAA